MVSPRHCGVNRLPLGLPAFISTSCHEGWDKYRVTRGPQFSMFGLCSYSRRFSLSSFCCTPPPWQVISTPRFKFRKIYPPPPAGMENPSTTHRAPPNFRVRLSPSRLGRRQVGTSTPSHASPSFLKGELLVELKDGRTKKLKAGDTLAEVINTPHNGKNIGKTTLKIAVFYAGNTELKTTVLCP